MITGQRDVLVAFDWPFDCQYTRVRWRVVA